MAWVAAAGVVALLVLGLCWTLASPIGASPDDDFHLSSIWCSATAPAELCRPGPAPSKDGVRSVRVAAQLGPKAACFAFHPEQSAACQGDIREGSTARSRANDGLYPGGYYALMGLFAGSHPIESALLMRMVAWVLGLGVIVAAAAVARGSVRRSYVIAVIATSVPLGVFLLASNNPSGAAVAGVAAFWCASLTWLEDPSPRRRVVALVVAGFAAALALGARADAGIYLATVAGAGVLLTRGWQQERRGRAALLTGIALAAVLLTLSMGQTSGATAEELVSGGHRPWSTVLWYNVTNLPVLWTGSFGDGARGLGWLDTQMPTGVSATMVGVTAALVYWSSSRWDRLRLLSLALVAVPLTVLPLLILNTKNALANEWIQPRYLLPILPVALGTMLLDRRDDPRGWLTPRQLRLLGVLVTLAHAAALHANIRRYVTGQDVLGADLNHNVEWWWDIPIRPLQLWMLGSVAFAAVVAVGLTLVHPAEIGAPETARSLSERRSSAPPDQRTREVHVRRIEQPERER